MSAYRFLYANLLTGAILGELPLEACSFGETLNAPGAFSGTMALRPYAVDGLNTFSGLDPAKTALYVERDGVIIWGGVLWSLDMDVSANSVTLAGEGWHSLVRLRRIVSTLTYTALEQTTIAANILAHIQGQSGGSLGITNAATATGVTRDRTYLSYELKNAGEAIEQLAAVRGGFDFRYQSDWSAGAIVTRFLTYYPATGRTTAYVLDLGANVELLRATVDGKTVVNRAFAKGAGEGDTGLLVRVDNAAHLGVYPIIEDVTAATDVTVQTTLQATAQRTLDRGQAPMIIPSVMIYPNLEPALGSFIVGDQVKVRGSYGLLSINDTYRITQWAAQTDSNGAERVTLTLAPLTVFTNA